MIGKCVFYMLLGAMALEAKNDPITIVTVTDASVSSSAETMKLFRQKILEHSNLLKLVGEKESPRLVFLADCLPREKTTSAFVCHYILHYSGGAGIKTFMGGGVNAAATAEEMADSFLGSAAQDIAERMNQAIRENGIYALETCLALTQSSCAVPEGLMSELKVKTINLSQYVQAGGLKK